MKNLEGINRATFQKVFHKGEGFCISGSSLGCRPKNIPKATAYLKSKYNLKESDVEISQHSSYFCSIEVNSGDVNKDQELYDKMVEDAENIFALEDNEGIINSIYGSMDPEFVDDSSPLFIICNP